MRKKIRRAALPEELTLAIGLTWGFLNARQFNHAYRLARGCLSVWPDEQRLILMQAYAAAELLEPLDERMQAVLQNAECKEWVSIVRRRAEIHCDVWDDA